MSTEGVRYMEQLLIVEDDIGLNQGLCKALKVDDRKIISCKTWKRRRSSCFAAVYPWSCWISICRMAVGLNCYGRSRKTHPGFLLFCWLPMIPIWTSWTDWRGALMITLPSPFLFRFCGQGWIPNCESKRQTIKMRRSSTFSALHKPWFKPISSSTINNCSIYLTPSLLKGIRQS